MYINIMVKTQINEYRFIYIYVNTNVCYKINMFAYRVVETIKKYYHHESWGKKELGTHQPPALPLSYRGKRFRSALSIVVVSVRSVLKITSGCCGCVLIYTPGQVNKISIWHPLLDVPGYVE